MEPKRPNHSSHSIQNSSNCKPTYFLITLEGGISPTRKTKSIHSGSLKLLFCVRRGIFTSCWRANPLQQWCLAELVPLLFCLQNPASSMASLEWAPFIMVKTHRLVRMICGCDWGLMFWRVWRAYWRGEKWVPLFGEWIQNKGNEDVSVGPMRVSGGLESLTRWCNNRKRRWLVYKGWTNQTISNHSRSDEHIFFITDLSWLIAPTEVRSRLLDLPYVILVPLH